mgnify:CR=1 FL=1
MDLEKPIRLAQNRAACASIVTTTFPRAAAILADYLGRITGGSFPIRAVTDVTTNFLLRTPQNAEEMPNPDSFRYRIYDKDILLEAPNEQAAVYGVYDFLETVCGCRYYTPREEFVPFDANLSVQFSSRECAPVLAYREVYYRDFFQAEFAEKHKMTSQQNKDQVWGFWCHSFATLCPPEVYFPSHPEYFALYQGKRVGENAQPCLSNPDVLEIMTENLRRHMEEKPQCRFWSISQNDNNAYCTCPRCREINEREGSPMGSVLDFVNRIAARFPDKTISTLAYWYTRKPPKTIRPAKNVHIMLCNIEANRGEPIETDPRSAGSREELLAWEQICPSISLWDYCIEFRNLVSPFPNLRVIPQNIRFFAKHHVTMLFSQGNREYEGEFSALRGYLLAKCMWQPDVDADQVIDDFCRGYYGPAAPFLLRYIQESTDAMEAAGGELNIFGGPEDGRDSWLDEAHFARYESLAQQALDAVRQDAALYFRVCTAVMPVWYAGIVLEYGDRSARLERIGKFASHARLLGLERVEEWHITPDQFLTDAMAALQRQQEDAPCPM